MYKCVYFSITELVHPQILKQIGSENSWLRLNSGCLQDLDTIRREWGGEVIINSGVNDSRGLRPPNDPDGSYYSTHKQGTTFDLVPKNGEHFKFYHFIKKLIIEKDIKHFNTMEHIKYTSSWVHVAKMNHSQDVLIIKP
tara:strand:+ start:2199 stop:2615 length:417 start_codon:yes stop_codon:yes gene_type:complete